MRKITRRFCSFLLVMVLIFGMNTMNVSAAQSAIKISGNTAITQITLGKSCSLSGTITSTYKLTNVTGSIKDISGSVKFSKSVNPGSTKYVLKSSAIDNALKFGKLGTGSYVYTVTAKDSKGVSKTLITNNFSVTIAAGSGTASTLKISGAAALTTLQKGKSYSLTGTISSNYLLTNVTATIKDSAGTTKFTSSVNPKAAAYNLAKSTIDNALSFGKLAVGNYTYVVTAKDASGKSLTLIDNAFTVSDGTVPAADTATTIKVTGATALTTLEKGKSWSLSGTITSNYNLTNVTGSITDANNAVKYTKSVNPAAKSYVLKSSAIDNALLFGKLSAGTYHYTVTAKDASGSTATVIDNTFTVTDGTVTPVTPDEPATGASELKIDDVSALTTLAKGKSYTLTGTITSNYNITSVTGSITDTGNNVKYTKTVNPAAKSYALTNSAIDNALLFGKLAAGTYHYVVTAKDASGADMTLIDNTFTVTDGTAGTGTVAESTLKITGVTAITSLTKGKIWHCNGTIASNYKLTKVTGVITDNSGKTYYSKTVNPSATSYVLKNSTIDNALGFSKLAAGTYRYTISATDASGKTLTLVDNTFTVK